MLDAPTREVTRTISKRAFFERVKALELGRDTPAREMTVAYVPLDHAAAAIDHLPSPSLILLIGKVDWLFAVHTGLFLRDAAGNGHFFHASSKSGAVLDDDLAAYLDGSTRHLGFSAYRIEKPDAR